MLSHPVWSSVLKELQRKGEGLRKCHLFLSGKEMTSSEGNLHIAPGSD